MVDMVPDFRDAAESVLCAFSNKITKELEALVEQIPVSSFFLFVFF